MNKNPQTSAAWDIEEMSYCAGILRTCGDKSVPADSVPSYLRVVAFGALRDGFPLVSRAFLAAESAVNKSNWENAYNIIVTLISEASA